MLVSDWKGPSDPGLAFWTISAVDKIDLVLAAHYGFTEEELDFIRSAQLRAGPSTQLRAGPSTKLRAGNYDIKYRKGRPTTGNKSDSTYKLRQQKLGFMHDLLTGRARVKVGGEPGGQVILP